MLNFNRYKELKRNKVLTLAKINDGHVVSLKRFDPETGAELSPEVISLSIPDLEKNKEMLIEAANNIEVLIEDLKKIK